ncbi:CDP-glycerol glycerophosphotransferase family protein [Mammaliicoccus vitulinus]|uniref:CDP-glycerol glycerophosphotransferase family protein n=1 Tax=Mammaliicoccus vitulinus TaxID=71237 RepID=UPI003BA0EF3F
MLKYIDPRPLLFNSELVIDSIKNIDSVKKEYQNKYDLFFDKYCNLDDGKDFK